MTLARSTWPKWATAVNPDSTSEARTSVGRGDRLRRQSRSLRTTTNRTPARARVSGSPADRRPVASTSSTPSRNRMLSGPPNGIRLRVAHGARPNPCSGSSSGRPHVYSANDEVGTSNERASPPWARRYSADSFQYDGTAENEPLGIIRPLSAGHIETAAIATVATVATVATTRARGAMRRTGTRAAEIRWTRPTSSTMRNVGSNFDTLRAKPSGPSSRVCSMLPSGPPAAPA